MPSDFYLECGTKSSHRQLQKPLDDLHNSQDQTKRTIATQTHTSRIKTSSTGFADDIRTPDENTRLLCSSYPGRPCQQYVRSDVVHIQIEHDDPELSRDASISSRQFSTSVSRETQKQRQICLYITIIVGIIMLVMLMVTTVLITFVKKDFKLLKFLYETQQCTHRLLSFFLLSTVLIKMKSCQKDDGMYIFKEKQYILTISTSGAVAFGTLCFLAGEGQTSEEHLQYLTIMAVRIGHFLGIIVIILQTIFIIYSEKLCLISPCSVLDNSVVILGIINFTLWIALFLHMMTKWQVRGLRAKSRKYQGVFEVKSQFSSPRF